MDADRQRSSHPLKVLAVVVMVAGIALCGIVISVAGFADEFEAVEYPQVLTKSEVPIGNYTLLEHPTEEDWYAVSVQSLEDNGWTLAPNLTMVYGIVPCRSYPVLDRLEMYFADAYFDGVVPSLKMASVSFDQNSNTASVQIEYQALRWRHDTLDLSKTNVGLYEALEIADRHGGRDWRESVKEQCMVSVILSDYEWVIGYKESGEPWSEQRILVDSRTGKAKQVSR